MLMGKYILVIFHSLFVIKYFRGTCSSSELLKGYMARESLIALVLYSFCILFMFLFFWNLLVLYFESSK